MATSLINDAFMRLNLRAEMSDRAKLVATFVDVGPLFTLLSTRDHQILYGRRGTGKTHALTFLVESRQEEDDLGVFIDMRTLGSSGGLYSDSSIEISQRATRLLIDVLGSIHDGLYEYAVDHAEEVDLSKLGTVLDDLAKAITEVSVRGNIEQETTVSKAAEHTKTSALEAQVSTTEGHISLADSVKTNTSSQAAKRILEQGVREYHIHFGTVSKLLQKFAELIAPKRIWIVIDEWSSLPRDLQPYLADFLKRSIFPLTSFTVKIAAIEQRSLFRIPTKQGDYIGVELGADISANLSLDDFLVFDNDASRAREYFQELIYKHYREVENLDISSGPTSARDLLHKAFTQEPTFDEFVRAAEGVPRDAINILNLAAQRALSRAISVEHIRTAARDWYQRDKYTAAKMSTNLNSFLHWIIDKVIGERRARAFLFQSDTKNELIDELFDARVLHILKRNISSLEYPGVRYDVYKLDYGCYVDLITTEHAPQGLLPFDAEDGQEVYVDVPPDDYRAIRRAILDIGKFLESAH